MAYDDGTIGLHARIKIRMTKEIDGKPARKLVSTTMGRVIFNGPIPQDLGFVDRSDPENDFKLEVDFLVNKETRRNYRQMHQDSRHFDSGRYA